MLHHPSQRKKMYAHSIAWTRDARREYHTLPSMPHNIPSTNRQCIHVLHANIYNTKRMLVTATQFHAYTQKHSWRLQNGVAVMRGGCSDATLGRRVCVSSCWWVSAAAATAADVQPSARRRSTAREKLPNKLGCEFHAQSDYDLSARTVQYTYERIRSRLGRAVWFMLRTYWRMWPVITCLSEYVRTARRCAVRPGGWGIGETISRAADNVCAVSVILQCEFNNHVHAPYLHGCLCILCFRRFASALLWRRRRRRHGAQTATMSY